jgi:hypothetical protein
MRADLVVMSATVFDHDSSLLHGTKPFVVQGLVAQFPVKAFVGVSVWVVRPEQPIDRSSMRVSSQIGIAQSAVS